MVSYNFDPPTGLAYDLNINSGVSVTLQGINNNLPFDPNLVVFQRATTDSRQFSLFRVAASGQLIIRNIKLANGGVRRLLFRGVQFV